MRLLLHKNRFLILRDKAREYTEYTAIFAIVWAIWLLYSLHCRFPHFRGDLRGERQLWRAFGVRINSWVHNLSLILDSDSQLWFHRRKKTRSFIYSRLYNIWICMAKPLDLLGNILFINNRWDFIRTFRRKKLCWLLLWDGSVIELIVPSVK
jgi:hypothetical protein